MPVDMIVIISLIVILGYFLSKVASRLTLQLMTFFRIRIGSDKRELFQSVLEKGIVIASVILAIIYLGADVMEDILNSIFLLLPRIMLGILIFILGSVVISVIMWFIRKFVYYLRFDEYFSREARQIIYPAMLFLIKLLLYLTLLNLVFAALDIAVLGRIMSFILYPIIILFFFAIAIGMINPIRDVASKIYLTHMLQFRPGSIIRIKEKEYTIQKIKTLYTQVIGSSGDMIVIPNRVFSSKMIEFKTPQKDIDTLEKVKDLFVAQLKSHCGPATMQMALSVFKYDFDQKELGALMNTIKRTGPEQRKAGTHPDEMIKAAETITKGEVLGAWIDYPKIYDLKNEVIVWLKQGGLVIVDIKRKYVFPNSKYAHYSLVVGVKGDEFLVVDPGPKTGGVYYADYRDVLIGMDTYSELIGGKRGYIILAPKGTEAYMRIRKGMVYYHADVYDKVTKRITLYLSKISNPKAIQDTMPEFMKRYLSDIEIDNQIRRVWKPSSGD